MPERAKDGRRTTRWLDPVTIGVLLILLVLSFVYAGALFPILMGLNVDNPDAHALTTGFILAVTTLIAFASVGSRKPEQRRLDEYE